MVSVSSRRFVLIRKANSGLLSVNPNVLIKGLTLKTFGLTGLTLTLNRVNPRFTSAQPC